MKSIVFILVLIASVSATAGFMYIMMNSTPVAQLEVSEAVLINQPKSLQTNVTGESKAKEEKAEVVEEAVVEEVVVKDETESVTSTKKSTRRSR